MHTAQLLFALIKACLANDNLNLIVAGGGGVKGVVNVSSVKRVREKDKERKHCGWWVL